MFVPVWVPTVVLLQPYVGFSRVRIPTVKHTNADSHVMPKESDRGFPIVHPVTPRRKETCLAGERKYVLWVLRRLGTSRIGLVLIHICGIHI